MGVGVSVRCLCPCEQKISLFLGTLASRTLAIMSSRALGHLSHCAQVVVGAPDQTAPPGTHAQGL